MRKPAILLTAMAILQVFSWWAFGYACGKHTADVYYRDKKVCIDTSESARIYTDAIPNTHTVSCMEQLPDGRTARFLERGDVCHDIRTDAAQ